MLRRYFSNSNIHLNSGECDDGGVNSVHNFCEFVTECVALLARFRNLAATDF